MNSPTPWNLAYVRFTHCPHTLLVEPKGIAINEYELLDAQKYISLDAYTFAKLVCTMS